MQEDSIYFSIGDQEFEVLSEVVQEGEFKLERWSDLPYELDIIANPMIRILDVFDGEGNRHDPTVLTKKQHQTIMELLNQKYWDEVVEGEVWV